MWDMLIMVIHTQLLAVDQTMSIKTVQAVIESVKTMNSSGFMLIRSQQ